MQVNSESEFWQLHGSLNVVDGLGKPVAIRDNARLYFRGQHGARLYFRQLSLSNAGTAALCSNPTPGAGSIGKR